MQESAIEEYFKPIDKEAEALMKIQLEGEERSMKDMVKVMQQQALFKQAEADVWICDCQPQV
ncbi:putative Golgin subfamily A member 6-like protein 4 [Cucumis melo var. makuwa]|uniref:Golgin subfamily A member 6-like protein 4 n=1 Tax=Cucumis melo var. makuwa TaxID=1194695 RepID=A0A5D3E4R2_CUCMM|nr:putative Golgin subfamily A member 6-like protein 4 [Cucumis melo var. makuwa]TYK31103.1 putative Golgin subfamily A member 6-like protein 4 [Cucumis melo var. makuwa]